jgi:flagellar motility protein MotE (MotC chaperone)
MGKDKKKDMVGGLLDFFTETVSAVVPNLSNVKAPMDTTVTGTPSSTVIDEDPVAIEKKLRDLELSVKIFSIIALNRIKDEKFLNGVKEWFTKIPLTEIEEGSKELVINNILPPLQFTKTGGEDGDGEGVLGKRKRRLSIRAEEGKQTDEIFQKKIDEAAAKRQQLEENKKRVIELQEVLATLEGVVFDKFKNITYEELPSIFKNLANEICKPRQTNVFVKGLFTEDIVEEWIKVHEKTYRAIYELHTAEMQCRKADELLGRTAPTDCYLCGYKMEGNEDLAPSCEHVLPIIQAIFFLDLYRHRDKEIGPDKKKLFSYEYEWAHRKCNLAKESHGFLETRIDSATSLPTWEFSETGARTILELIYEQNTIVREKIGKDKEAWVVSQTKIIKETRIDQIVEHIKSQGNGGMVVMMGLNNCVDYKKLNYEFSKLLVPKAGKRKTRRGVNKKRTTYRKRRRV